MPQKTQEPYGIKSPLQAGMSGMFIALAFVLMITVIPSFSAVWFTVSLISGILLVIFSVLCKLNFAKNNIWIKFAPGWIPIIYILMLSMRSLSHLFSSNLLGIGLPLVSFIAVGLAVSLKLDVNIPGQVRSKSKIFGEWLSKIALAFASIAGVFGASFGMYAARTGKIQFVTIFIGIFAYFIGLSMAYRMFTGFLEARKAK